jgi:Mrp family chromosome partitioning ATPase
MMTQTLEICGRNFDFVLLDSAPLLPVFDSHALTAHSDTVLLVARSCVTTKRSVKTSLELIEKVNGKVTGVVLNAVDLNDYAQYYYHSHYAYEYGSCPTADGMRSA